ncbi:TPA: hypothetical protein N0F65_006385, partial [Lagenidium giganteum]
RPKRPSSSTPSVAVSTIETRAQRARPFLSLDLFRLLVRLEGQRVSEVDATALERAFHLPAGYSSSGDEQAAKKKQETFAVITFEILPRNRSPLGRRLTSAPHDNASPGAYEVPELWPVPTDSENARPGTSAFASRAERDPFLLRHVTPVQQRPATEGQFRDATSTKKATSNVFITGVDRGLLSTKADTDNGEPIWDPDVEALKAQATSKRNAARNSTFDRRSRLDNNPTRAVAALGPDTYNVQRLWDTDSQPLVMEATPSPFFGKTTEARELRYSPLRTVLTNARADGWNSSPHYIKHKKTLERYRKAMEHSASAPELPGSPTQRSHLSPLPRGEQHHFTREHDPFEWLRRQPNGEHRLQHLAKRTGLNAFIHASPQGSTQQPHHHHQQQQQHHHHHHADSDQSGDEDNGLEDAEDGVNDAQDAANHEASSKTDSLGHEMMGIMRVRDDRIAVCCRMPGGLIITARIHASRKVRNVKSFLLHKQQRFQAEDEFDLYLTNGRKLSVMDERLHDCGIKDKTIVQVVAVDRPVSSSAARDDIA